MKRYIDVKSWARAETFRFFLKYELPRFNMTFDIDVTKFVDHVKRENSSFYLSFMHEVIMTMNTLENFQYRLDEKGVFLEPIQYVSFTDKRGEDLFKMVFCEVNSNRQVFIETAKRTSIAQGDVFFVPASESILNTVYVTSFPWRKFNHFSHATLLGPKDSVPRVSWSRFEEKDGRKILTFSIEAHHALVDGVHVAKLIDAIEQRINR